MAGVPTHALTTHRAVRNRPATLALMLSTRVANGTDTATDWRAEETAEDARKHGVRDLYCHRRANDPKRDLCIVDGCIVVVVWVGEVSEGFLRLLDGVLHVVPVP